MLSDYSKYLFGIRNSFIRSGVELKINNYYGYEDIFYLCESLSNLLWYYSILEISGSEERLRGFMFPLNRSYSSIIRDKYFEEYLLYRAGYMQISTSDALSRENDSYQLGEVTSDEVESIVDEDGFIVYKDINEQEDDPFSSWESVNNSYLDDDSVEDDPFSSWDNQEQEDDETLEDDDPFVNWVSDEQDEYGEDDDPFKSWGDEVDESNLDDNLDDEVEFIEYDEFEDDDPFASWGNDLNEEDLESDDEDSSFSDEDNLFDNFDDYEDDEDDPFKNSYDGVEDDEYGDESFNFDEEDDDDDPFSSWGSDDEDESFDDFSELDDEDDPFSNWDSDDNDEDDPFSSSEDAEDVGEDSDDPFSNWDSEDDEDDPFSNWDSDDNDEDDPFSNLDEKLDDEDDPFSESSFSSGGSEVQKRKEIRGNNDNLSKELKKDLADAEKTYQTIEKITSGIFTKGSAFRSKLVRKLQNMEND